MDTAAAEDTPSLPPRRSDMALHPSHPPALISRGRPRLMGCGGAFRPSESAEGRFKDRAKRKSQGVKGLKKKKTFSPEKISDVGSFQCFEQSCRATMANLA